MFVDASALVAVLLGEPERETFLSVCNDAEAIVVSPIVVWESAIALARVREKPIDVATERTTALIRIWSAEVAVVEPADGLAALDAFARFGKGRHAARLNLGDCFSYAMAKRRGLPLLYKGNDFALTDIERAPR
jgi:ribonuclease VapC